MLRSEDLFYVNEDVVQNTEETTLNNDRCQAKVKIPEWLEDAESPYKWLQPLLYSLKVYVHDLLTEKLLDYKNQGPDYGFEKFVLLLTLVCMDPLQNEISNEDEDLADPSSEDKIDPEKTYKDLEQVVKEMRSREGDVMYSRIRAALEHVLTATRANMLHLQGRDEESMQVARNLVPVAEMSVENKAAFEGIKAKFIVFLHHDGPDALEANRRAIELDPNFAYWNYFIAKIMRRERRNLNEDMTFNELEFFQKAVEMERNPKFLVFLAQANQEMAWVLANRNPKRSHVVERMFQKAADLYSECWKMKNDSAAIARRVGNGMRKMKYDLKGADLNLAKEALHKATELSPSIDVTFHTLGKLYLDENNEEKALQYFNHVKGDFCTGELIRHQLIKDPNCDVSEHIQYLIEFAEGFVKQDVIWCDVAWYYLFFKRDLMRASNFLWKVLRKEPDSCRVLKYQTYIFFLREPLNFLEVLVNEIKIFIKNHEVNGSPTADVQVLSNFIDKIYEKHPYLQEMIPDPNLLPSIRKQVDSYRSRLKRYQDEKNNSVAEKNKAGSWRTKSETTENENKENNKGKTNTAIENWRVQSNEQNRNEVSSQNNNNHSGWYRARYSTRDYRETDREIESIMKYGETRNCTENNRETGRYTRGYRSRPENDQNRGRHQDYNNRYDTTITNWRAENRH